MACYSKVISSLYLLFIVWHNMFVLQYGETPLHMAAKNGCADTAQLLLAHGACIEAKANVYHLVTIIFQTSLLEPTIDQFLQFFLILHLLHHRME